MRNTEVNQIEDLIDRAEELPYGSVRTELLVEAVRRADVTRDLDVIFWARMNLTEAATFSGHAEKAFASFAWCVAQLEDDPDRFCEDAELVLWHFKFVLGNAYEFPQISRQQFERLCNQMETLYRQHGYNNRPVNVLRCDFAMYMGDHGAATEAFRLLDAESRDDMADCEACEADELSEYHDLAGDYKKALDTAAPNLTGKQSCAEVPHRTLSLVLRPLAMLGRYDEADRYQQRGYRRIRNNQKFLRHIAMQLTYLAHRNRPRAALGLLERHLAWALDTREMHSCFCFHVAAKRVLSLHAENKPELKCNFPKAFPLYEASARYDVATLVRWFDQQLTALGKRFDARAGNHFTTTEYVDYLLY